MQVTFRRQETKRELLYMYIILRQTTSWSNADILRNTIQPFNAFFFTEVQLTHNLIVRNLNKQGHLAIRRVFSHIARISKTEFFRTAQMFLQFACMSRKIHVYQLFISSSLATVNCVNWLCNVVTAVLNNVYSQYCMIPYNFLDVVIYFIYASNMN